MTLLGFQMPEYQHRPEIAEAVGWRRPPTLDPADRQPAVASRLPVRRETKAPRSRRLSRGVPGGCSALRLISARTLLATGIDPSQDKKEKKAAEVPDTFRAIAEEHLDRLVKEGRAEATLPKTRWLLDFAYPVFGDLPIREINSATVLKALRLVEARGRYESARRLRSTIGTIFRYAIATVRAETDRFHPHRLRTPIHPRWYRIPTGGDGYQQKYQQFPSLDRLRRVVSELRSNPTKTPIFQHFQRVGCVSGAAGAI